jgi:hypothetical protein
MSQLLIHRNRKMAKTRHLHNPDETLNEYRDLKGYLFNPLLLKN